MPLGSWVRLWWLITEGSHTTVSWFYHPSKHTYLIEWSHCVWNILWCKTRRYIVFRLLNELHWKVKSPTMNHGFPIKTQVWLWITIVGGMKSELYLLHSLRFTVTHALPLIFNADTDLFGYFTKLRFSVNSCTFYGIIVIILIHCLWYSPTSLVRYLRIWQPRHNGTYFENQTSQLNSTSIIQLRHC